MKLTRLAPGGYPSFLAAAEAGLNIPDEVMAHPALRSIVSLAAESLVLTNVSISQDRGIHLTLIARACTRTTSSIHLDTVVTASTPSSRTRCGCTWTARSSGLASITDKFCPISRHNIAYFLLGVLRSMPASTRLWIDWPTVLNSRSGLLVARDRYTSRRRDRRSRSKGERGYCQK